MGGSATVAPPPPGSYVGIKLPLCQHPQVGFAAVPRSCREPLWPAFPFWDSHSGQVLLQPALPAPQLLGQLLGQLIPTLLRIILGIRNLVHRRRPPQELLDLRLQLRFHLLHTPVAHGLVLGGVGLVFAPIQGQMPHPHQTRLPAPPGHFQKQPVKGLQVLLPEIRPETGKVRKPGNWPPESMRSARSISQPPAIFRELSSGSYIPQCGSRTGAASRASGEHLGMVGPRAPPYLVP